MAVDKVIFYLCATLIAISIIFSLSLPVFTVLFFNYDEFHFFIRQFAVGCIGIFLMWWLSRLNPDKALVWIGFGLLISCGIAMGLMHALPASMVTDSGGARRWIRLPGFSLAPVEFFKVGFVYFLAWSFTRKFSDGKRTLMAELKILLPYIILFGIAIFLIAVMQNDLGQVVVLALTFVTMALFAGASVRLFGIGILGAAFVMTVAIVSSEHRILRIKSWWGTIQNMVLSFLPDSVANVLRALSNFSLTKCNQTRRVFWRGAWSWDI